ncbi:MAG: glucosaminidase domain-containing protein [Elusimicrobia bacterium]|nr:glucosaminidase domain-containing protein [Elusimicrobiota bacterium]
MEQKKQTFIFSICDSLRKYNLTNEVKIFIACQFALESNFGTSQLARNRNNFCGMKTPLVRISSANNAGKPLEAYASYSSLNDCVDDYMLCIQYHRPMSTQYDTIKHYTEFIRKFYCPEKDYIERIEKIVKDFLNIKN